MPHVGLHLLLAERVLGAWEQRPWEAPFAMTPASRNAFRHGALGPDMGYFPGADPLASDLAHHARPVGLTRALLRHAADDLQAAYAWGWLTHVLGDVAIHPLVNERCGEMRLGLREPLMGDQAPTEHIAVEVGLDLALRAETGRPLVSPLEPVFEAPGQAEFVVAAYRDTYGRGPTAAECWRAHQRIGRCVRALAVLHRVMAGRVPGRGLTLGMLRTATRPGTPARGLFQPDAPPAWLRGAVLGVVGGFEDWYLGHQRSELRFLRDTDLGDGRVLGGGSEHARRLMDALHRRSRLAA